MIQFPHHYNVSANVQTEGNVELSAEGLSTLQSAPPKEFGGPGDQWSPEDLIVAAVADCFVLTFRAIAAASKLDFSELKCDATGTLDKVERVTKFTEMKVVAYLKLPADADESKAQRTLEKAKGMCFITNSLNSEVHLETHIEKA